jgi:hypothetical protein
VDKEITYQADDEPKGASMYVLGANKRWALSSTGNFMDNDDDADEYTVQNTSRLSVNASSPSFGLYRTARVSPLSLTYYGICLGNGNYTVNLHFAEIIFTDDNTLYSLGKRLFDIYVQVRLCSQYSFTYSVEKYKSEHNIFLHVYLLTGSVGD